MNRRKGYWAIAVAGAACAALILPATTAASAKTAPTPVKKLAAAPMTAARAAQPTASSVPALTANAATDYWTPERMKTAKPKDTLEVRPGQSTRATVAPLTGSPGSVAPMTATTGGTWPSSYNQRETKINGKVFLTDNWGNNYECSGSVVNSLHKTMVWTAGHCVFDNDDYWCDQPQGYYHNWTFVPGYKNGAAPYGKWTASRLSVPTGWCNGIGPSAIPYDTGAVNVHFNSRGQAIANVVGANGLSWNTNNAPVWSFGYPAASPFNGATLRYCQDSRFIDTHTTYNQAGHKPLGIRCRMTGGSSGGPWLTGSPAVAPGTGVVNGHNDYKYTNDATRMYSPYYGTAQGNLYNHMK